MNLNFIFFLMGEVRLEWEIEVPQVWLGVLGKVWGEGWMQANGCGAWENFFASFPHVLPPHLPPSVLSGCKGGWRGAPEAWAPPGAKSWWTGLGLEPWERGDLDDTSELLKTVCSYF